MLTREPKRRRQKPLCAVEPAPGPGTGLFLFWFCLLLLPSLPLPASASSGSPRATTPACTHEKTKSRVAPHRTNIRLATSPDTSRPRRCRAPERRSQAHSCAPPRTGPRLLQRLRRRERKDALYLRHQLRPGMLHRCALLRCPRRERRRRRRAVRPAAPAAASAASTTPATYGLRNATSKISDDRLVTDLKLPPK